MIAGIERPLFGVNLRDYSINSGIKVANRILSEKKIDLFDISISFPITDAVKYSIRGRGSTRTLNFTGSGNYT
jgi:hypothetical protein